MADNPNHDDQLRQTAAILTARPEAGKVPLDETQRTAVQEATLAVVRDLRGGKTVEEVEQGLIKAGWQAAMAGGFIRLVGQLLTKMYLVRTCLFAFASVLTAMLASVVLPLAGEGQLSWMMAGLMVFITLVSMLAMFRNFQLWRRFRALKSR
jgi:hypothetical protein